MYTSIFNLHVHVCCTCRLNVLYMYIYFNALFMSVNVRDLSGFRVTGGELFDEIVAREYYSETDARYEMYTIPQNEYKVVSV